MVETCSIHAGRANLGGPGAVVHVLPKPGVTDPEAEAAHCALARPRLRRGRGPHDSHISRRGAARLLAGLIERVLANDAVEQAVVGPLALRASWPGP